MPEPEPEPAPAPQARPRRSGPAHSRLSLTDGDQQQLLWQAGADAPDKLVDTMARRVDAQGHLPPHDDGALPLLLRLAAEAGHRVDVAPAVWLHLAAHRDARTRCALLADAYPHGPASAALQHLLTVPLPLYQAEGALWAVVAGRALLADAPGLGKGVQAIAATQLWRQHFGLRRVLVLCSAAQAPAWQRAWPLLAGLQAQTMSGGLHQRQALWSVDAEIRILTPEALASDAAHVAHWAPELVIVDEPQRLLDPALPPGSPAPWAGLAAPQALVLCGGPLDRQPELLDQLVDWLDPQRLGPLAALRQVRMARDSQQLLADEALEQVADQLSRVLLQRDHADVADQLPPVIYSARLLPLAAAQHQAHGAALRQAHTLVQAWQRSGFISDNDQWRLSALLRSLQQAAHRANPADAHSPLAEAVLQAAEGQLADWAESLAAAGDPAHAGGAGDPAHAGGAGEGANPRGDAAGAGDGGDAAGPTVVLCDSLADRDQLAQRLGPRPGLHLVAPEDTLPDAPARVLQVGVPWRTRQKAISGQAQAAPGQHWVLLAARNSIDIGLLDTLAGRVDVPRGPAEPGSRGFLSGERLTQWLNAVAAALAAVPADSNNSQAGAATAH